MVMKHDKMKKVKEDPKNFVETLVNLESKSRRVTGVIMNVGEEPLDFFSGDRQSHYRASEDKVRAMIKITFFEDPIPPLFEFSSAINGADRKSVERYLRREYKRAKMEQVRKEENDGWD